MKYEIDDNFAVRVFSDEEDVPFLFQPNYPNEDSFDSYEEAETWAKLFIDSNLITEAPYAPNGKGLPGQPKETKEQLDKLMRRN